MIRTETFTIDGRQAIRTWSDAGVKIHGGFPEADYNEAIDFAEFGRTYTETDIPIEQEEESEIEAKAEAYDILVGGVT